MRSSFFKPHLVVSLRYSSEFVQWGEWALDVVKALLEVGRRELVMLTADDGVSCLYTSGENGHLDVVKVGCASWC